MNARGFTLLELMVTVAIVAIVSSVAFSAFESQNRKARRTDAIVLLEKIAQAQQRFLTDANTFTTSFSDLKRYGIESDTTASGHYTVTLSAGTGGLAEAFVATAKPSTGQDKDNCKDLSVEMNRMAMTTRSGSPDRKTCWGSN